MKKLKSLTSNTLYVFIAILSLVSCRTAKIDANTKLTKKATAKEVLAIHKAKSFKYKTLQSKVKVSYDDGKKAVSPSVSLRMEKDKQIWLSAKFLGFTVAKIYITPNRVSFYEKLGKRYYDGDFQALSSILGQEVGFEQMQNLFLGQNILEVSSKNITSKWQAPNLMAIRPKEAAKGLNLELLFYLINSKVASYKVSKDTKSLVVVYEKYQKIGQQDFPEVMQINAKQSNRDRTIGMVFKGVEIDRELSFPYSIPDGYTKFQIGK